MYKMVFKLAPPYLSDRSPNFVSERSSYSLRSADNLCLAFVRTERHNFLQFKSGTVFHQRHAYHLL